MYGCIWRTPAPIDAYNALHREVIDLVGSNDPEGLLVHFAYPTPDGHEVVEVWESKDQVDEFSRTILPQAMERLHMSMEGMSPEIVEFDPVDVITPRVRTPAHR